MYVIIIHFSVQERSLTTCIALLKTLAEMIHVNSLATRLLRLPKHDFEQVPLESRCTVPPA